MQVLQVDVTTPLDSSIVQAEAIASSDIDWIGLWRQLVNASAQSETPEKLLNCQARFLSNHQERNGPLLDFVLQNIKKEDVVLDVGAGAGRWSIALAGVANRVTAVEPSDAMLRVLLQNMTGKELSNIRVLQSKWEDAAVDVHDIVICVHSIYFSPDLPAFVRKMERLARRTCYLALRLPARDGIVGELSLKIYGSRHDSCNAIVAHNALHSIGIYANVLVERNIVPWVDTTFEQAFARAKRRLRLESTHLYDDLIKKTLANRLTRADNVYLWPDGMRSALLWWQPSTVP